MFKFRQLARLIGLMFYVDGDGAGGGATPTPTAAPGATPTPSAATPTPTPAPSAAWYSTFQDAGVKEWLGKFGDSYPNPEAVALKAYNLEKYVGADKSGRGVIAPAPNATPEERRAFYAKVGGVPEKADGYALPEKLKDDPMAGKFREMAHGLGMPAHFVDGATKFFLDFTEAQQKDDFAKFEQQVTKDVNTLKTEWGADYDRKVELGRRAAQSFIPHKTAEELKTAMQSIEGALGTAFTYKLWAAVGEGLSEHSFVQGGGSGGMGGTTPEAARAQIETLKKDKEFGKKVMAGDAASKQEWDRLHRIAYGAPPA